MGTGFYVEMRDPGSRNGYRLVASCPTRVSAEAYARNSGKARVRNVATGEIEYTCDFTNIAQYTGRTVLQSTHDESYSDADSGL